MLVEDEVKELRPCSNIPSFRKNHNLWPALDAAGTTSLKTKAFMHQRKIELDAACGILPKSFVRRSRKPRVKAKGGDIIFLIH